MVISKDIRKLAGNKLKHYTVTQGACSDGSLVYMVFERKDPHRCKIAVYDMNRGKVVRVSGALKLGHGNDICIRDGIIYATHSEGSKTIHRVNASTLKQMKGVKVTIPKKFKDKTIKAFNGICCYGSGFLLRVMGGRGMIVVNKSMKVTRYFKTDTSYKTSQGMTMDGKTILRAFSSLQSGKNYIVEYSVKGKEKRRYKAKIGGEMEGVFVMDGKRYVTAFIKKDGRREAFIGEA